MKKIIKFLRTGLYILLGISTIAWANSKNITMKTAIFPASFAPSAGIDSPAIQVGNLVFISGQGAGSTKIAADSYSQIEEAFKKLGAVAQAAGGSLNDIVKINVYLTDLSDYSSLNKIMEQYFKKPYPARSTVGVSKLPKDHRVEIDAIMVIKK